jgi:hypothetical protein
MKTLQLDNFKTISEAEKKTRIERDTQKEIAEVAEKRL